MGGGAAAREGKAQRRRERGQGRSERAPGAPEGGPGDSAPPSSAGAFRARGGLWRAATLRRREQGGLFILCAVASPRGGFAGLAVYALLEG